MNGKKKDNTQPEKALINEERGYYTPEETLSMPDSPGVYIMKDAGGAVIYVGKAISLKKRVTSYFRGEHDPKTRALVSNIAIIDTIKVGSESEALILEANLIKEYKPRYNVIFKDNKFYPFIRVTVKEDFPRIVFTRENRRDGSRYFGPYTSAGAVRVYIDLIQRLFFLRTCYEMPKKECLNYHIKRCTAPCIGKVSRDDYARQVRDAVSFLSGDVQNLVRELETRMRGYAAQLQFEKAQAVKDKIDAIRLFEESQSVYLPDRINCDFIGVAAKSGKAVFVVTMVRLGRMVGKRSYSATLQMEEEAPDILDKFILDYFSAGDKAARYIIIDTEYSTGLTGLNRWFIEAGYKTEARVPAGAREQGLLRMAHENAALHLSQLLSKIEAGEGLRQLQEVLSLDTLPMRIEGFDIANILGENAVASLVSFAGGKPDKKNYRHLKIKGKDTPDDFAMIAEAVGRRYRRLRDENTEMPDLVLIDGGRGQLNAALGALSELGISLNVASLAKQNEEIYTPYKEEPIVLPRNSEALRILQQVRDETHRFANSFYNKLKSRDMLESVFDHIPGIGEKRKKIIVQNFLNYDIMNHLNEEDLINKGIPRDSAGEVLKKLRALFGERVSDNDRGNTDPKEGT